MKRSSKTSTIGSKKKCNLWVCSSRMQWNYSQSLVSRKENVFRCCVWRRSAVLCFTASETHAWEKQKSGQVFFSAHMPEHQHPTLRFRGRLNETSEKKKLRLTTLECCCGTCSVAFYSISGAFTSSRAVIYPGIQPREYSHTYTDASS